MDILFIRHAESESNAGLRTEHPATIRLTERGQSQAALTAKILTRPALVVIPPASRVDNILTLPFGRVFWIF
jgi:broad specificity phosphatase PhoE